MIPGLKEKGWKLLEAITHYKGVGIAMRHVKEQDDDNGRPILRHGGVIQPG